MNAQVLTPREAAVLLGLDKTTVIGWCERGILPAIRIESRWYLKRQELIRDGWLGQDGSEPSITAAPSRKVEAR